MDTAWELTYAQGHEKKICPLEVPPGQDPQEVAKAWLNGRTLISLCLLPVGPAAQPARQFVYDGD